MSGIGDILSMSAQILHDRVFPPKDPHPDFAGRNVIVTGSNVGVGFEAAVKFVALGAKRVILGVRSLKKGEDAKKAIEERTGRRGVVEVWHVDMMDYGSIKAFATRAETELESLEVAVLNAGLAQIRYVAGVYGWETTLQVNTISTALLSILLLPKLQASRTATYTPVLELVSSGNSTVIKVTDEARKADDSLKVYNRPSTWEGLTQYSISKLFLQFVQTGLIKQLGPVEKAHVEIVTVCPGATRSEIVRDDIPLAVKIAQKAFYYLIMKPTEQGARTYIGAVDLGGKGHGRFYQYAKIQEPAKTLTGPENEQLQEKVWRNILSGLREDVPEVDHILSAASSSQ